MKTIKSRGKGLKLSEVDRLMKGPQRNDVDDDDDDPSMRYTIRLDDKKANEVIASVMKNQGAKRGSVATIQAKRKSVIHRPAHDADDEDEGAESAEGDEDEDDDDEEDKKNEEEDGEQSDADEQFEDALENLHISDTPRMPVVAATA